MDWDLYYVVRVYFRYYTPKEGSSFTALWFYVVPLDEHSTRVINHAVIVQPLPGIVKVLLNPHQPGITSMQLRANASAIRNLQWPNLLTITGAWSLIT